MLTVTSHLIYLVKQYAKAGNKLYVTKSSIIKVMLTLTTRSRRHKKYYKSTEYCTNSSSVSALFMIGGSYSGCHIECNSISLHIQMSNIINLPLLGISHRQGWIRRDLIWPLLPAPHSPPAASINRLEIQIALKDHRLRPFDCHSIVNLKINI